MSYVIRYVGGGLAGWPEPLVFETKKEATVRKNRLAHQTGDSLVVESSALAPNCREKFRGKRQ